MKCFGRSCVWISKENTAKVNFIAKKENKSKDNFYLHPWHLVHSLVLLRKIIAHLIFFPLLTHAGQFRAFYRTNTIETSGCIHSTHSTQDELSVKDILKANIKRQIEAALKMITLSIVLHVHYQ